MKPNTTTISSKPNRVSLDTAKPVNAKTKELAALEAQIAQLKAKQAELKGPKELTIAVSAKGAVSVYGLSSRFPVTLYASQWKRVLQSAAKILAFIEANEVSLATKESAAASAE